MQSAILFMEKKQMIKIRADFSSVKIKAQAAALACRHPGAFHKRRLSNLKSFGVRIHAFP